MIYVEAPNLPLIPKPIGNWPVIFMGGGITGCPDWQVMLKNRLSHLDIFLINPRRKDFDVTNPNMEKEQITWEHEMLKLSDAICFWFPAETLCPITLYELGTWTVKASRRKPLKPLFIGVHPEYKRKNDVIIQTGLARPDQKICHSLESMATEIEVAILNGAI